LWLGFVHGARAVHFSYVLSSEHTITKKTEEAEAGNGKILK